MTEKMNIHQVLADLKVLDARIAKLLSGTEFALANKHGNEKIGGKPLAEVNGDIKATYQKVRDLMKRRAAMRASLVKSNAETTITICGKTMTVAEAIEMKSNGIAVYQRLLKRLRDDFVTAQDVIAQHSGDRMEQAAERYVSNMLGQQAKEANKNTVEIAQQLRQHYIENNSYDLIDPINIKKEIEETEKFVDDFTANIDAALAVSNATTIVTIES